MDSQNRQRYLTPQQYFKKINDYKRQVERLQSDNQKLRHSLSKFMKFEVALKSSKIETVKSVINQYYSIDMECKVRDEDYVKGRRIYYVWLRKNTSMPYSAIAKTLSLKQDHSSIIHSINQHEDYIETDKLYLKEFNEIMSLIDSVLSTFTENS